jgi:ubiquinone/menaquinone biosynthesis C-methylase UbiE
MQSLARELEPEVMDDRDDALAYDAMDHTAANTAFVQRLVELGASGLMLDLGTGPGHQPPMICHAIPRCRVVGVDLSFEMLRLAEAHRHRAPHTARMAARIAARIAYVLADARRLPFADACFDTVLSNTILHHLPRPIDVLREARRVLRPCGTLLIRDLYRPPDVATLDDLVQRHAGHQTPRQRQLFRDSLKAALTPDEMRQLLADLGWTDVEVTIDTDRHLSCQRPGRRQGPPAPTPSA